MPAGRGMGEANRRKGMKTFNFNVIYLDTKRKMEGNVDLKGGT
jgi:hypothetical protein